MMKNVSPTRHARLTSAVRAALRSSFTSAPGRALDSFRPAATRFGTGLATAACALWLSADSQAQTRVWTPATNDYNTAANWVAADVPDSATETALFGFAAILDPTVNSLIAPDGFTFTLAAPAYTVQNLSDIDFVGAGIVNNSLVTQTLNMTSFASLDFFNASTAGSNVTINNVDTFINFFNNSTAGGATLNNGDPLGLISFFDTSTAGFSTINNSGNGAFPSSTTGFFGSSTGGNATINNSGDGSNTFFSDTSDAGSAVIINTGAGSSTDFFAFSSAADATIRNDTDFTTINFTDNSNAGVARLNNNAAGFIEFFLNANAAGATINNFNALGLVDFFDTSSAGFSTINNSGSGATPATSSVVSFFNSSSAGSSFIQNNGTNTQTIFSDTSTAASATVFNNGANSRTIFVTSATAGSATITNNGFGSSTTFSNFASGGSAALINAGPTTFIDISQLSTAGTTAGSIAGDGALYLGSKNLAVGSNGTSTTFSGIIQDGGLGGGLGGSLTKVGLGELTLTGANSFTGNTTIDGGSLIIEGSTASPATTVNQSGLLGGSGVVGGSVTNRGVVRPGNAPQGLTVSGSYTQTSEGDLRIAIASNTTFGKLKVGGTANVAGSVTAVGVNGFKPERGDRFTFLTASGGVVGEFDSLNSSFSGNDTILQLALVYDANSVSLEFQQGSFVGIARTPNQIAVARELDSVAFDKRARRLIAFLNQRSLSDLPDDLDRIAPEEFSALFELAASLATVQNLHLQQQTYRIRNGASGFVNGVSINGNGPGYTGTMNFSGVAGPTGSEGKDKVFTPTEENKWGVFLTGVGEWVDVGNTQNARGFDLRTGGLTLGIDYKVSPNFALGVTAGYTGTDVDLANGGNIDVNGGRLGVYATYFTGGFYVDAAATGGYNNYDTSRPGLRGTARGDTDAGEFNGLLGTGYDFKTGGWSFGPTANVQYTYLNIDGFTERGSLAPLRIEEQNSESLRSALGARVSYDINLSGGLVIRPEVRAAWQHEFQDRSYSVESGFASGAGNGFSVRGPEIGRDSLLFSAGLAAQFNDRVAAYLGYDAQFGRQNYDSHSVSGGFRLAF